MIYGTAQGLASYDNQLLSLDSLEVQTGVYGRAGDQFGKALVAGDFDGDGNDDLVIGLPLARTHSYFYSGAVHFLYGEEIYQGSSFPSQQVWHQNR